jgi:hypothetical protein
MNIRTGRFMIRGGTWETGEEIQITYAKKQRNFYEKKDRRCIYDQFERQVGINKGNFVEMIATKYFQGQGYNNVESYYYKAGSRHNTNGLNGQRPKLYA